jgi:hypothetical protein
LLAAGVMATLGARAAGAQATGRIVGALTKRVATRPVSLMTISVVLDSADFVVPRYAGDPNGAIHIDSREITYTPKNLAYVLLHESAHIYFDIPQALDNQAVYWGDHCAK